MLLGADTLQLNIKALDLISLTRLSYVTYLMTRVMFLMSAGAAPRIGQYPISQKEEIIASLFFDMC